MKPKFKDVAHFYLGVQLSGCSDKSGLTPKRLDEIINGERDNPPILKPMSEITEEDFREFATLELLGKNEKMAFDFDKYLWRACSYEITEDSFYFGMNDSEIIDEENENDCSNILMLHRPNMSISEGWFSNGETYSPCDLQTNARWIAFLCSKSFNVFNLPESEIATI